jgi:hypothetical protein
MARMEAFPSLIVGQQSELGFQLKSIFSQLPWPARKRSGPASKRRVRKQTRQTYDSRRLAKCSRTRWIDAIRRVDDRLTAIPRKGKGARGKLARCDEGTGPTVIKEL